MAQGVGTLLVGDDPAAVHAAYARAMESRDGEAFVALFAADAVLKTPFGVFRGSDEIHAYYAGVVERTPGFAVSYATPTAA